MEFPWTRLLKSTYRRDPLISVLVTVGIVDAAIGGLSEHWSLLAAGLGTAGTAIACRWWQTHRDRPFEPDHPPIYTLPPAASHSLPRLTVSKKQPPHR